METHYVSVGIEANSKQEAEQKMLKLQQIATEYKPREMKQGKTIDPLYADLFKLAILFGSAWLNDWMVERAAKASPASAAINKKKGKEQKSDKIPLLKVQ